MDSEKGARTIAPRGVPVRTGISELHPRQSAWPNQVGRHVVGCLSLTLIATEHLGYHGVIITLMTCMSSLYK